MWQLVLALLEKRLRLAAFAFVATGLFFSLYAIKYEELALFAPYLAFGVVGLVVGGGLLMDERERRNALMATLPVGRRQVAMARILWPIVLQSVFYPPALILWAIFNWNENLTVGVLMLILVHGFLLVFFQVLIFWEELKGYLRNHAFGRIVYWVGPLLLGAVLGFTLSRNLRVESGGPLILLVFYIVAILLAGMTYGLFMARKDYSS